MSKPYFRIIGYEFGAGAVFPAGTVTRIYSGQAAEASAEPGIEHLYLRGDGEVPKWELNANGTVIEIRESGGNVQQPRTFTPDTYSSQESIIVRNGDNTRAFVFLPSGSEKHGSLQDGRYRVDFIFKRKIEDKPALTRMGRDNDEKVAIEFSLPPVLPGQT